VDALRQQYATTSEGRVGIRRDFPESSNPQVRKDARAYSAAERVLTTKQSRIFEDSVPTAQVVRLPGLQHYVYLSNEANVLREMKSFLSNLP
jgi:non-heme chloroperoxidase